MPPSDEGGGKSRRLLTEGIYDKKEFRLLDIDLLRKPLSDERGGTANAVTERENKITTYLFSK